jgi:hypothetical protein
VRLLKLRKMKLLKKLANNIQSKRYRAVVLIVPTALLVIQMVILYVLNMNNIPVPKFVALGYFVTAGGLCFNMLATIYLDNVYRRKQ